MWKMVVFGTEDLVNIRGGRIITYTRWREVGSICTRYLTWSGSSVTEGKGVIRWTVRFRLYDGSRVHGRVEEGGGGVCNRDPNQNPERNWVLVIVRPTFVSEPFGNAWPRRRAPCETALQSEQRYDISLRSIWRLLLSRVRASRLPPSEIYQVRSTRRAIESWCVHVDSFSSRTDSGQVGVLVLFLIHRQRDSVIHNPTEQCVTIYWFDHIEMTSKISQGDIGKICSRLCLFPLIPNFIGGPHYQDA